MTVKLHFVSKNFTDAIMLPLVRESIRGTWLEVCLAELGTKIHICAMADRGTIHLVATCSSTPMEAISG